MGRPLPPAFAACAFLGIIFLLPVVQVSVDHRQGKRPAIIALFTRLPSVAHFQSVERAVDESNWLGQATRPEMQALRLATLRDAGSHVLAAPDAWFFYQPGVETLTQRRGERQPSPRDALAAVRGFRHELALHGIRLVLLPVPNKESVYPDRLTARAAVPAGPIHPDTIAFLEGCRAEGIEVVDLFRVFSAARRLGHPDLYLAQDTHWSPAGLELAAAAVASELLFIAAQAPASRTVELRQHGDLVRMLRSSAVESRLPPEPITCHPVSAALGADDPRADILLLGDSFLRVFETDEPTRAGFPSHLARCVGRPVGRLVNDGGASTLVRQQLCRQAGRLRHAKVIVWQFVERDLQLGTDGWQIIKLPEPGPPVR